ncbi:hypothetical protein ILFOPFJJ_01071 [Ensifer psoraleae]|uniref:hypothetical protein n=1 Tax=Sinorhizobium psoraleae TaxID=520838 RepID=UPI001569011F|nr:hypothetical protein [Sinorhizobium psoraleae]NRP70193.1 hypothetical protein [Sinorhizobium psoraleae]
MLDENNHAFVSKPIPRNPGYFLTIADVAETIAEPGEDKVKMIAALRQFASQGYLWAPFYETESRGAYLYAPATCIVCAVLLRMIEMGIRDKNACHMAAKALYQWNPKDFNGDAPDYSPGALVIKHYVEDVSNWTLELWSLRHDSGKIVHDARIYNPAAGGGPSLTYDLSKFAQRAVLAIDLGDVLDRMHSRVRVN